MDATSKTGVAQPHRGCTICANCRLQLWFLVAHRLRGKPPTVENIRSRIQGKLPSGGGRLLLGFPDCLSTEPQCGIERDFVQENPATLSPSSGEASVSFFSRRGSQDVCTIGTAASQGAAAAQLLCVAAGRASTHVPIFHSVGHSLQPGLMTMSLLE